MLGFALLYPTYEDYLIPDSRHHISVLNYARLRLTFDIASPTDTSIRDIYKITMTTLNQEFDLLAQSVNQTLTAHHQQLQIQQEQIKSLTQLLNSCRNSSVDSHCISAIDRLIEMLDRHQQSASQVYSVLNALTQAKDARNLTIDTQGEIATYLKLELGELAQRLGIDRLTKLSTAANSATAWSKLMAEYADPDDYQWQFPSFKRGFYHKTHQQVIGTKTIKLVSTSSLN
jgi:uncharacterized coiled-coil protein SlyX